MDALVLYDEELTEMPDTPSTDTDFEICRNVAQLVPDRACIQIGHVPSVIWKCLEDHKDLGVHSEMISDGFLNLYEKGVVTNKYKEIHTGFSLCSYVQGSKVMFHHFFPVDFI